MEAFQTNVIGDHLMIKNFLPLLRKGHAKKIINISSDVASLSTIYGGNAKFFPDVALPYRVSKVSINMGESSTLYYIYVSLYRTIPYPNLYNEGPNKVRTTFRPDGSLGVKRVWSPLELKSSMTLAGGINLWMLFQIRNLFCGMCLNHLQFLLCERHLSS